jgi:predicted Zn-dependent peptidase
LVERHFGALGPAGEIPPVQTPRNHPVLQTRSRRSLQQVHFCIAAPAIEASHPLRFACYVMNVILGGSMSSRLFQNIRERQGLVYSIFSELNMYRDSGCLGVYGGASPENVRKVVDGVLGEFRRVKESPVEPEELRRAKDHMKGSLMLSLESTTARMGNLARQELYFRRTFTLDEMVDAIESVTLDEIQSLANQFFQPATLGVALLGKLDGQKIERGELNC